MSALQHISDSKAKFKPFPDPERLKLVVKDQKKVYYNGKTNPYFLRHDLHYPVRKGNKLLCCRIFFSCLASSVSVRNL